MGNKGTLAGVFCIIGGGLGVILGLLFMVGAAFLGGIIGQQAGAVGGMISTIYSIIGIVYILLGALGVIGGIFSLRRKNWGLVLAASIAGILTITPFGIVAIIFAALGKSEFSAAKPAAAAPTQPAPHQP